MREILADANVAEVNTQRRAATPRIPQPLRNLEGRVLQEQAAGVGVDPAQPLFVRELAQGG